MKVAFATTSQDTRFDDPIPVRISSESDEMRKELVVFYWDSRRIRQSEPGRKESDNFSAGSDRKFLRLTGSDRVDFIWVRFYTGKVNTTEHRFCTDTTLEPCETVLPMMNYMLYCDNYFTTI